MVDMGENHQAQRLLAAAAAFGQLAGWGFRVEREPDPHDRRGATVEVGSDTVTFTVATDWWESDLRVWVTVAGAKPSPSRSSYPRCAASGASPVPPRAACSRADSSAWWRPCGRMPPSFLMEEEPHSTASSARAPRLSTADTVAAPVRTP
jgi:hypothetical protein